ncbi:hypothetical protein Ahy_B03g066105 [Arachis hypogaea]|uniref:Aminotransferase-like plant mobile domain-containing protein n=1 Tax=Arachis hypogaea TaxID=3818 RepID=A0A445A355_ARAHY|nr:hypothetical protein Ahy_B03g066105 [Arachis hypogaea]
MSSYDALEVERLHQFGIAPRKTDCRGSFIKLMWLWNLKDRLVLIDEMGIQREFSWGLPCLAHLYKAMCRISHFDCKEIDVLLTLLLTWVVWEAYGVERIELDMIPTDIH